MWIFIHRKQYANIYKTSIIKEEFDKATITASCLLCHA
jgi:hypothetical protein